MTLRGGCLCGAVRYTLHEPAEGVVACHCSQCRRWSGHVWAGLEAGRVDIEGPVTWYRSSETAERGFCPACGSSLFWRSDATGDTEISAGTLDPPTAMRLLRHVWVGDKGDYHDIADGRPQFPRGSTG